MKHVQQGEIKMGRLTRMFENMHEIWLPDNLVFHSLDSNS